MRHVPTKGRNACNARRSRLQKALQIDNTFWQEARNDNVL